MRFQRGSLCLTATLVMLVATPFAWDAQASAQETVLHNFKSEPWGSLVLDGAGNLYGTTAGGVGAGSRYPFGMVFELSPKTGGGWTEKVLHTFGKGEDGQESFANLIFDTAGNLYGTTYFGGSGNCRSVDGPKGCGTVFELSPKTGGGWIEKVLYNFQQKDGASSTAGLIMDGAGNLYGTMSNGGKRVCTFTPDSGCGTVFELRPGTGGVWTETTLHTFDPTKNQDGSVPESSLVLDASGNLYGTTNYGGAGHCQFGCGTIFELSPQTGGGWTETILYRFAGTAKDGAAPVGSLTFDKAGKNLYGTTYRSHSTVFELTPKSGGGWTKKILHTFGQGTDGDMVFAGVVFDAQGNLYGTGIIGGTSHAGTVFELSPKTGGGWTEKVVNNFQVSDGTAYPGVIVDGSGNIYGTTINGGPYKLGEAFKIKP